MTLQADKVLAFLKAPKVQMAVASVVSSAASALIGYKVGFRRSVGRLSKKFEEDLREETVKTKAFYQNLYAKSEYAGPSDMLKAMNEEPMRELSIIEESRRSPDPQDYTKYWNLTAEYEPKVENIFESYPVNKEFDYEAEERKKSEKRPFVITDEQFEADEPEYTKISLTYFGNDDILLDDHDEVIPDIENTVGQKHMTMFGYGSNDDEVIYIRNDRLEIDFEVVYSNLRNPLDRSAKIDEGT